VSTKRILIRLSALAGVVALGLMAVIHSQRGTPHTQAQEPAAARAAESPPASGAARSGAADSGASGTAADPFARATQHSTTPPQADRYSGIRYAAEPAAPRDAAPPAETSTGLAAPGGAAAGAAAGGDPFAVRGSGALPADAASGTNPLRRAAGPAHAAASDAAQSNHHDPDDPPEARWPLGGAGPEAASRGARPAGASEHTRGDDGTEGSPLGAAGNRRLAAPGSFPSPAAGSLPGLPAAAAGSPLVPAQPGELHGAWPASPLRGGLGASWGGTASAGNGEAGPQELEGPQAPSLVLTKQAPAEIQVGKPAVFEIRVENAGRVSAADVVVRDTVPRGTQLIVTAPPADVHPGGELVWSLGTLAPGEQQVLKIELLPVAEGEIGSVATVHFGAAASVRTVCTRAEVRLEVQAPRQVLLGQPVTLRINVRNTGTGAATGVVLTEHIPPQLRHPQGDILEYDVGELRPGESRDLELTLDTARPGMVVNRIAARGDGAVRDEREVQFEVVAPALDVAIEGPRKRYLDREATYRLWVVNPGTAPARDVELACRVPPGMRFVAADNYGEFDAQAGAVVWSLAELPAGQRGAVHVTFMAVQAGEQKLVAEAAAGDLFARREQAVEIEGVAAILFEVLDVHDPIELGGETVYEIRVVNQGSKTADDVQLVALLPPQLKPLAAEGPVRHVIDGQRVLFDRLPKLAPRADTTYRVRVQGVAPGDLRMEVQLITADMAEPVAKQESTRVYADP
jgi:uncharacterized repeat protein (TIGR01451 family)